MFYVCVLWEHGEKPLTKGRLIIYRRGVWAEIYFRHYSLFYNWNTHFWGLGVAFFLAPLLSALTPPLINNEPSLKG